MKTKTTRKIRGPHGLTIELDKGEIYPDDPGQGTPAMVYRHKGKRNEGAGTFWCVVDTGELADDALTSAEGAWLEGQRDIVDQFLYGGASTRPRLTYYTWEHNIEGCLRNGSFVRRSLYGLGQFMNGDFMGFLEAVPAGMIAVETKKAHGLIPSCCK